MPVAKRTMMRTREITHKDTSSLWSRRSLTHTVDEGAKQAEGLHQSKQRMTWAVWAQAILPLPKWVHPACQAWWRHAHRPNDIGAVVACEQLHEIWKSFASSVEDKGR